MKQSLITVIQGVLSTTFHVCMELSGRADGVNQQGLKDKLTACFLTDAGDVTLLRKKGESL